MARVIEVAADLHHRFGPDAELTVGAVAHLAGAVDHGDGAPAW